MLHKCYYYILSNLHFKSQHQGKKIELRVINLIVRFFYVQTNMQNSDVGQMLYDKAA